MPFPQCTSSLHPYFPPSAWLIHTFGNYLNTSPVPGKDLDTVATEMTEPQSLLSKPYTWEARISNKLPVMQISNRDITKEETGATSSSCRGAGVGGWRVGKQHVILHFSWRSQWVQAKQKTEGALVRPTDATARSCERVGALDAQHKGHRGESHLGKVRCSRAGVGF